MTVRSSSVGTTFVMPINHTDLAMSIEPAMACSAQHIAKERTKCNSESMPFSLNPGYRTIQTFAAIFQHARDKHNF